MFKVAGFALKRGKNNLLGLTFGGGQNWHKKKVTTERDRHGVIGRWMIQWLEVRNTVIGVPIVSHGRTIGPTTAAGRFLPCSSMKNQKWYLLVLLFIDDRQNERNVTQLMPRKVKDPLQEVLIVGRRLSCCCGTRVVFVSDVAISFISRGPQTGWSNPQKYVIPRFIDSFYLRIYRDLQLCAPTTSKY